MPTTIPSSSCMAPFVAWTPQKRSRSGFREPGGLAKAAAAYFGASVGLASGVASAIFSFFSIMCLAG